MSGRPRVLVVEDDADIAGVLRRSLDKEGYDVRVAGDGEAALEESGVFEPDAVVLDLGLPKLDGIEVARRMRAEGDVPILMLTARDTLDARVEGLDSGADDYLVKPFERDELLARIRALLRRRPPRGSAFIVVGDLRLNPDTREVFRGDRELELTAREFELLEHLMRNARHRRVAPGAARRGLGLSPLRRDQHGGRVHLEPAAQARGGRRAARAPHDARRGLRGEGGMRTRLPVKLKVAVLSAALTFAILCLFAVVVGTVAERRIVGGFDDDLRANVGELQDRIALERSARGIGLSESDRVQLAGYAAGDAIVRVVDRANRVVWTSDPQVSLGPPISGVTDIGELRVTSRELVVPSDSVPGTFDAPLQGVTTPVGYVQYAKPERTITTTSTGCGCSSHSASSAARCSPSWAASSWLSARCARSRA